MLDLHSPKMMNDYEMVLNVSECEVT